MRMNTFGPNVQALVVERWSQLVTDRAGDAGGPFGKVAAVVARLSESNGGCLTADMREAVTWAEAAIAAVKRAPGSTWTDDEAIAAEIMRLVKEKRNARN